MLRKTATFFAVVLISAFVGSGLVRTIGKWRDTSHQISTLSPPPFLAIDASRTSDSNKIDDWLRELVERAEYPSLSVAIVSGNNLVYQRVFRSTKVSVSQEPDVDTAYHLASVTKVFTATLAALLDEEGAIHLDDPASRYLPPAVSLGRQAEVGKTITLRHLASHTSGLPRSVKTDLQTSGEGYQLDPDRLYDHLAVIDLEFTPGEVEQYSNLGYGLLGHILERASQKSYRLLLEQYILSPLSMKQTGISGGDTVTPISGFSASLPRQPSTHSYSNRLVASGGIVASSGDLASFISAQFGKVGWLSEASRGELHQPTRLNNGQVARTALGWSVRVRQGIGVVLKKNGGRHNASTWVGFSPRHQTGVVVLANCGKPRVDPIGYWLLERIIP